MRCGDGSSYIFNYICEAIDLNYKVHKKYARELSAFMSLCPVYGGVFCDTP